MQCPFATVSSDRLKAGDCELTSHRHVAIQYYMDASLDEF